MVRGAAGNLVRARRGWGRKVPEWGVAHWGGRWHEGKRPKNAGSYFGYIDECQFLNGVIAGHMTKSNKIGFIAAKPIPQVLRNINAFTHGARSVKPGIATSLIFTGDWTRPVHDTAATNSLSDQRVVMFTPTVVGHKVSVSTAAKVGTRVRRFTTPPPPPLPDDSLHPL